MWKKIKEILSKHTAYKDEATGTSVTATVTSSVIDLRPPPNASSQQTETLYHHSHQPYRRFASNTLNKTNEHCRSLFNLLPSTLRPRHRQTSNKKRNDAAITSPPTASIQIDYNSPYMSQSLLNHASSQASCYSAVATTIPLSPIKRHGSIENLLYGHSKSNPANIRAIIRKNFEPFAQAHIMVRKGMIVTVLFSRGSWLYIRLDSNQKMGYIPRIICSLYQNSLLTNDLLTSSTDSSSMKENELDLTKTSLGNENDFLHPYKRQINRYLSHSSAIINDPKQRMRPIDFDERDRRNTYTLPRPPPRSNLALAKDRRSTLSSIHCPLISMNRQNENSCTNNNNLIPTRDTDSSSTQDSGYSESTPFFLVQQSTPDKEQPSLLHSNNSPSKKAISVVHYTTARRSSLLRVPDPINPSQSHPKPINATRNHRHTLLNGVSMCDMLKSKRHSFGLFDKNEHVNPKIPTNKSIRRPPEFALIRNVRQDKPSALLHHPQQNKPSISNLPKSHIQIPASIILNHHRQKQQFGSSHSAFRPVQPAIKHKRASSEGHSPSISRSSSPVSSLSSSSSSSNSPINVHPQFSKRRRLSCDLPVPMFHQLNSNSLTRSVCDPSSSSIEFNQFSRTMSDILCDQFSEINLDAIEKDSLLPRQSKKSSQSRQCLFTIVKDYRSSRASFTVKRGDCVQVLKQVGRACYLVRKQINGQIGFLPKALLIPATSTRVETFLEMHGYRETII